MREGGGGGGEGNMESSVGHERGRRVEGVREEKWEW